MHNFHEGGGRLGYTISVFEDTRSQMTTSLLPSAPLRRLTPFQSLTKLIETHIFNNMDLVVEATQSPALHTTPAAPASPAR